MIIFFVCAGHLYNNFQIKQIKYRNFALYTMSLSIINLYGVEFC